MVINMLLNKLFGLFDLLTQISDVFLYRVPDRFGRDAACEAVIFRHAHLNQRFEPTHQGANAALLWQAAATLEVAAPYKSGQSTRHQPRSFLVRDKPAEANARTAAGLTRLTTNPASYNEVVQ